MITFISKYISRLDLLKKDFQFFLFATKYVQYSEVLSHKIVHCHSTFRLTRMQGMVGRRLFIVDTYQVFWVTGWLKTYYCLLFGRNTYAYTNIHQHTHNHYKP